MADRETRANRKKRRQELIAQAMRDRETRAAGSESTGTQGGGAPRGAGSEVAGKAQAGPKKVPLPD